MEEVGAVLDDVEHAMKLVVEAMAVGEAKASKLESTCDHVYCLSPTPRYQPDPGEISFKIIDLFAVIRVCA